MNNFKDLFKPISIDEGIDRMFPLINNRSMPYTEEERAVLKLLIECLNCNVYRSYYVSLGCIDCQKKVPPLTDIQIECIRENIKGLVLPVIFYDALGWKSI